MFALPWDGTQRLSSVPRKPTAAASGGGPWSTSRFRGIRSTSVCSGEEPIALEPWLEERLTAHAATESRTRKRSTSNWIVAIARAAEPAVATATRGYHTVSPATRTIDSKPLVRGPNARSRGFYSPLFPARRYGVLTSSKTTSFPGLS
jgi:hypothetical protein